MNKTSAIVLLVVVVLIGIAIGTTRSSQTASQDGPITVGFIGPLTGDGASYGEATKAGVEIAVAEINAGGGIDGRNVEVIYEDAKCTGKDAATATQKLVSVDKVNIIIGGSCSGETLAAVSITEPQKVLLFSPASSSPDITTAGDFVFRNAPSDVFSGQSLAAYISKRQTSIAIVSESTDFAQAVRRVFTDSYKQNGGSVVFDENYAPGTKDFRSTIAKIVALNPESIYINAQTPLAFVQFMTQLRQAKYPGQVYSYFLTGPEVVQSGDAVNGVVMIDAPSLAKNKVAEEFLKLYKARNDGKDLSYPYFTGAAYDAMQLIAKGIEKHGEDTEKIRDYLYGVKNYEGTIGAYSFDQNGDINGIEYRFLKIENNTLVDLPG